MSSHLYITFPLDHGIASEKSRVGVVDAYLPTLGTYNGLLEYKGLESFGFPGLDEWRLLSTGWS